mgnify:CR=1 FL=1
MERFTLIDKNGNYWMKFNGTYTRKPKEPTPYKPKSDVFTPNFYEPNILIS